MRVYQFRISVHAIYILFPCIHLLLSAWYNYSLSCDDKPMETGKLRQAYLPTLSAQQFSYELNYLINENHICEENGHPLLTILVGVFTRVSERPLRDFVRRHWGAVTKQDPKLRLVFILGLPENTSIYSHSLYLESAAHNDIIQADFTDTYGNLIYKSFAFFKWANKYCKNAKYALKIDGDMQINLTRLVNTVEQVSLSDNFHCGELVKDKCPIRDIENKWYVSMDIFSYGKYPTYCQGAAYLVSQRIVGKIADVEIPRKIFPVDDAFMTGILRTVIKEGIDTQLMHFHHHYDETDTMVNQGMFSKYIMTIHLGKKNDTKIRTCRLIYLYHYGM